MVFPLLLSAALAAAAPAPRPQAPATDAVLKLSVEMERIEPQVKELARALETLSALVSGYGEGKEPDARARGQARRAVEAARDRLKDSVSDFWHEAEEGRALKALEFFTDAATGKKTDAMGTATTILQPPAFPKTAMHMHQLSQVLLAHEENAYRAAQDRRVRQQGLWLVAGLVGLVAGALLTFAATELLWSLRRPAQPK